MVSHGGLHELLWMAAFATCIKLLLVPAYHSTDFEVHRHWLALTSSLPLKDWYLDETSEWTLDYPPFFAWFEWCLSLFARLVDPLIVDLVHGLNYDGSTVVLFHRTTVMAADMVLYWGLWRCCRKLPLTRQRLVYGAVVWSPGLFIVDHMHFQYNGFLLGILLLSLSLLSDGNDLMGGVVFAVLLCFKHLFAVAGPVYFVYLLRHYCRGPNRLCRFLTLGCSVLAVVLAAFGPFLYHGQIGQVLKRLFPFGRGLCHAYWAPNIWALYNTADKVLSFFLKKLGFHIHVEAAVMTGGLVGDFKTYAVLSQITPLRTILLVLLAMVPCLLRVWKKHQQNDVVRCVAYAYICGFMFGWHVHEKASLHFVIPLSLIAVSSLEDARDYIFLSTVSHYSLFPLLFEVREYSIKVFLLLLHTLTMCLAFSTWIKGNISPISESSTGSMGMDSQKQLSCLTETSENVQEVTAFKLLGNGYIMYSLGLVVVELYGQLFHTLIFREKLPFVPLMLISVYCALGMVYVWIKQLVYILTK